MGREESEATVGCSAACPERKWEADLVRMTRMERLGTDEKAAIMSGSFMVATLPDDAGHYLLELVQKEGTETLT